MAEIWGAAIAAVGVVGGAVIASNGAKSAANAQAAAAGDAAQTQLQMFNTENALYGPQRNLGYGADSLLAQLYGIPNPNAPGTSALYPANAAADSISGTGPGGQFGTPGVTASPGSTKSAPANFSNFFNSPGYQFTLQQGENAIKSGAAANGNLYSTNTLTSLNNYAQGQAGNQYNNYVQQLLSLAGLGGSATAGTANAATTAGNNISSTQLSAGNANASGVLGQSSAWSGALNSASGYLKNVNWGSVGGSDNVTPNSAGTNPWD
jgi:hypothetical protein